MIVKEIAPEAVIGQEYDYLHRYFYSVRAARKSSFHFSNNKFHKVAGAAGTSRYQRAHPRLEQPGPGHLSLFLSSRIGLNCCINSPMLFPLVVKL